MITVVLCDVFIGVVSTVQPLLEAAVCNQIVISDAILEALILVKNTYGPAGNRVCNCMDPVETLESGTNWTKSHILGKGPHV